MVEILEPTVLVKKISLNLSYDLNVNNGTAMFEIMLYFWLCFLDSNSRIAMMLI